MNFPCNEKKNCEGGKPMAEENQESFVLVSFYTLMAQLILEEIQNKMREMAKLE